MSDDLHMCDCTFCPYCGSEQQAALNADDARSKVIKAARDYILLPPRGDDPQNYDRLYVLRKAVEALEKVEHEMG